MNVDLSTINQFLADMLLPFMRISGMFAAMIGLSAKSIPQSVRALLAIFLTLVIMPVVKPVPVDDLVGVGSFLMVIQQLLIGIAIGFISMMVLNTFVLAGQIIAMQTGLGFASIVDPVNGINVPAVGQFYLILATLLFWTVDGHLAMIQMIVISFDAFPIGEAWWTADQFRDIAEWGGWMFVSAITLSLAPIVSLLIVNLAFGVMTKASPQLNIFSIGFSIAQIMGLIIIWITLDNFTSHFATQWQRAQQFMCELLMICPV
ncbi:MULTISPECIES: flagellar biosynthetic protein FliR [unclassified Alteromonas]|uniref:flagellar biosynthetic protein FliR n=1 Tax=unclassified Alteromonas TaxID=2614992 RepID=UPI000E6A745C|nr:MULTISPECIES: flagellar biosynthetic protein FliR [unclassified Alteromonas]AYA63700.1 flagellar type III secretion system protein FliR [Alteromonas sp. RKMC-009]MDO6476459.1 flagellar biosynthetic protein FliR [Alteromonas sp. 1_MG-2023]MEC7690980.1 flagellar biosynthetic protein FliR [Pseudomonadota bacterium]